MFVKAWNEVYSLFKLSCMSIGVVVIKEKSLVLPLYNLSIKVPERDLLSKIWLRVLSVPINIPVVHILGIFLNAPPNISAALLWSVNIAPLILNDID